MNPLIDSNQASIKDEKCADKYNGIAPRSENTSQPKLTVKKACIQPASFLIGKIRVRSIPKPALKVKPIRKSRRGEYSPLTKATMIGMIIKRLKPKISLPRMFRIVEKSLLSGEIIITFEVNPLRKSFLTE